LKFPEKVEARGGFTLLAVDEGGEQQEEDARGAQQHWHSATAQTPPKNTKFNFSENVIFLAGNFCNYLHGHGWQHEAEDGADAAKAKKRQFHRRRQRTVLGARRHR